MVYCLKYSKSICLRGDNLNILLDLGVVLIILFSVIFGIRRGAVRTLIVFIGSILAYAAAAWISGSFSQIIYASFFKQNITDNINDTIAESVGSSVNTADNILNSLPDFLSNAFKNFGLGSGESASSMTQGVIDQTASSVEALMSPLFIALISLILTIVLFSLFMVLVKIIARAANGIFKIPVLKQINSLGGAVIGLLQGLVMAYIIVAIMSLVFPFIIENYDLFKYNVIDQTLIFAPFYNMVF